MDGRLSVHREVPGDRIRRTARLIRTFFFGLPQPAGGWRPHVGCSFCLDFNYFMARNNGLDETKAREVPRWRDSAVFTPLERRIMEYAVAMCASATVTDEMSAVLLDELGADGLVELTARVGFTNLSARTNVALGIHGGVRRGLRLGPWLPEPLLTSPNVAEDAELADSVLS